MDMAGPLPATEAGNINLLVIVDHFTKRVAFKALREVTAVKVADTLLEDFMRFGLPERMLSDQGRNFMAQVFELVYEHLDVERVHTSPYHPETDGISERMVRTIKQMLTCYVNQHQDDWDTHLPYLAFAYNSATHASTNQTPYEMTFGDKPKMPIDLITNQEPGLIENFNSIECLKEMSTPDGTLDADKVVALYNEKLPVIALDYLTDLKARLKMVFDHAKNAREIAVEAYKFNHDRRMHPVQYEPGDLVLTDHPKLKVSRTRGLAHKFFGPFRIVCCNNNNTYVIRVAHKSKGKRSIIHHNRLKRYFSRANQPEEELEIPESPNQLLIIKSKAAKTNKARKRPRKAYQKNPNCVRWSRRQVEQPRQEMPQSTGSTAQASMPQSPVASVQTALPPAPKKPPTKKQASKKAPVLIATPRRSSRSKPYIGTAKTVCFCFLFCVVQIQMTDTEKQKNFCFIQTTDTENRHFICFKLLI
jgi:transposase InsO family protein